MLLKTFATCEPDKVFKDAGFTDMEIGYSSKGKPEVLRLNGKISNYIISFDRYIKGVKQKKVLTSFEYDNLLKQNL